MNVRAFNTAQLRVRVMQSFYLMRFANTVVIVAFERLRFLAVVFRENTSISLSKELRTQPVCQLGLSTPSRPPGLKIWLGKFLKFPSLFLDIKPLIPVTAFIEVCTTILLIFTVASSIHPSHIKNAILRHHVV